MTLSIVKRRADPRIHEVVNQHGMTIARFDGPYQFADIAARRYVAERLGIEPAEVDVDPSRLGEIALAQANAFTPTLGGTS